MRSERNLLITEFYHMLASNKLNKMYSYELCHMLAITKLNKIYSYVILNLRVQDYVMKALLNCSFNYC